MGKSVFLSKLLTISCCILIELKKSHTQLITEFLMTGYELNNTHIPKVDCLTDFWQKIVVKMYFAFPYFILKLMKFNKEIRNYQFIYSLLAHPSSRYFFSEKKYILVANSKWLLEIFLLIRIKAIAPQTLIRQTVEGKLSFGFIYFSSKIKIGNWHSIYSLHICNCNT